MYKTSQPENQAENPTTSWGRINIPLFFDKVIQY
jgi:hypothetical protein